MKKPTLPEDADARPAPIVTHPSNLDPQPSMNSPPSEVNSGEGAASALESLRKLEQLRVRVPPAEERLGTD